MEGSYSTDTPLSPNRFTVGLLSPLVTGRSDSYDLLGVATCHGLYISSLKKKLLCPETIRVIFYKENPEEIERRVQLFSTGPSLMFTLHDPGKNTPVEVFNKLLGQHTGTRATPGTLRSLFGNHKYNPEKPDDVIIHGSSGYIEARFESNVLSLIKTSI